MLNIKKNKYLDNNKAIKILRTQIVKIKDSENWTNRWTMETNTYLSAFFGVDSKQANHLGNHIWSESKVLNVIPEESAKESIKFLTDCIHLIENIGLTKPKGNFISRLSDRLIIFILTVLFTGGVLIGRLIYKAFECSN